MSRFPRPERIAAAARALGVELSACVTLYADALADSLAQELELVAWDREQLIGGLQRRLERLRQQRFREYGGGGIRVVERRRQPLEAVDLAWSELRQGRPLVVEFEIGACSAAVDMLRTIGRSLNDLAGATVLDISTEGRATPPPDSSASSSAFTFAKEHPDRPSMWPVIGPLRPKARIAIIDAQADRELAAYVLARTGLRRTGMDPRGVKRALVVGGTDLLVRHAQRLWLEAQMGPATAPESFAGPVPRQVYEDFIDAHEAWSLHPDVEVLCGGGPLERAEDEGLYLAPALFAVTWPGPDLPMAGPMVVIVRCSADQAAATAETAAQDGGQIIAVGARSRQYPGDVRLVRGALLVERLPPGLPDPRPV